MSRPGFAQPSGGAILHRSSSAHRVLAVGLLALGIGDLALIHRILLPRYFAAAPRAAARPPVWPATGAFALPAAAPPAPTSVPVPPPVAVAPAPVAVLPATPALAPPAPEPAPAQAEVGSAPTGEPPAAAPAEEFPDLLFAINATWLSPPSRETLDKVVEVLQRDDSRRVVLSGHTDPAGARDFNRALARARARRAGRYLRDHGIDRARVEIRSFGSDRPAESPTTASSPARKRRVEIVIQ